jgi:hypothetical protein
MTDTTSPIYSRRRDRRSGFNRRWIKSNYTGEERRSGKDRRDRSEGPPLNDLPAPGDHDPQKKIGYEKLMISATIQLEAVTRLLLKKGIVEERELLEMINLVQSEYQRKSDS